MVAIMEVSVAMKIFNAYVKGFVMELIVIDYPWFVFHILNMYKMCKTK